jgi:hypothetical protein
MILYCFFFVFFSDFDGKNLFFLFFIYFYTLSNTGSKPSELDIVIIKEFFILIFLRLEASFQIVLFYINLRFLI